MDQIHYEIWVEGHLGCKWSDWFVGLSISHETLDENSAHTILHGCLDQSALHGVLKRIFELGLQLLLVKRTELL